MPRWFSEDEKEKIRGKLLEQGEKQFSRFGFKKTSVDEIAAAVGISKGAFYRFFESKELLFMEIIEQIEVRSRRKILASIDLSGATPRVRLFRLLKRAFNLFAEFPMLQQLTGNDLDILMRGVPVDTFRAHITSDQGFIDELIDECRKSGISIQIGTEEMLALIYPLVVSFVSGFGQGDQTLPGNLDMHLELIAAYCLGEIELECQLPDRMDESNEEGKLE